MLQVQIHVDDSSYRTLVRPHTNTTTRRQSTHISRPVRVFQRRRAGELAPLSGRPNRKRLSPSREGVHDGQAAALPAPSCRRVVRRPDGVRDEQPVQVLVRDERDGRRRRRAPAGHVGGRVVGTPRGGADAGRSRAQDVGHEAAVEAPQPLARPEVAHGARGCRVLHHVAPDDGALLQDGADHLCANSR